MASLRPQKSLRRQLAVSKNESGTCQTWHYTTQKKKLGVTCESETKVRKLLSSLRATGHGSSM